MYFCSGNYFPKHSFVSAIFSGWNVVRRAKMDLINRSSSNFCRVALSKGTVLVKWLVVQRGISCFECKGYHYTYKDYQISFKTISVR